MRNSTLFLLAVLGLLCALSLSQDAAPVPEQEPYTHVYGNFTFDPVDTELGNVWTLHQRFFKVHLPFCEMNYTSFQVDSDDPWVATIENITALTPEQNPESGCHGLVIGVEGKHLGKANIVISVKYINEDKEENPCDKEVVKTATYEVVIMRPPHVEQQIFRFGVAGFLVILNFGFGCSLNLDVVKEIIRRPFAPAVGFCCQYIMMPLIGLCVSKTLLRGEDLFGFGLICSSCSPGGAGSNVWCLLLGGDVNLSLTMTFFSLSASLAMMPLWLFILSRLYIDPSVIRVPYMSILSNLALFVIPCFVGVLVRKLKQPIGERLGKMIKPLAIIFMAFLLTFGLYVNRYIYAQMAKAPMIIPPSILQPYMGFTFGFLIAKFAAKQPKYRAITIAIETGVQNVTIPMVMLQGSFPQPYGDLAAVMPVMTAHFTPLPLVCLFIGLTVYNKCFKERCATRCATGDDGEDKQDGKLDENDNDVTDAGKLKAIEANMENGKYPSVPAHRYERDSLLIQNGLTGSALGRKFFTECEESVI